MNIVITLDVKFRIFFITLSKLHEQWTLHVPIPTLPVPIPAGKLPHLDFNERGVRLQIHATLD